MIIGGDPGSNSGGLCLMDKNGRIWEVFKLKDATVLDTKLKIATWLECYGVEHFYLEWQGPRPAYRTEHLHCNCGRTVPVQKQLQGVKSIWTFAQHFGELRASIIGVIPLVEVRPDKWMKFLGCRTGGDKKVTKEFAQKYHPYFAKNITHWNADAILIAQYGVSQEYK